MVLKIRAISIRSAFKFVFDSEDLDIADGTTLYLLSTQDAIVVEIEENNS